MDDANANQTTTLAPDPGTEQVAQVGWRWRSRPGSVERGEISVLAIIETLVAMGLAVLIAVKWGTVPGAREVDSQSCRKLLLYR